jgi:hypothetical protein
MQNKKHKSRRRKITNYGSIPVYIHQQLNVCNCQSTTPALSNTLCESFTGQGKEIRARAEKE